MNDFNGIAPIYDLLSRLVFWGHLIKAQKELITAIPADSRILIVGGGTGKILDDMDRLGISLTVDFVEPAPRMIKRARQRAKVWTNLTVHFYQQRLEDYESQVPYDCIACFYFLDLFENETLKMNIVRLKNLMHHDAKLLVADFQITKSRIWQRALVWCMHLFFRQFAGLQSDALKPIDSMLQNQGLYRSEKKEFYFQLIFSGVYLKKVSKNGNHS